MSISPLRSRRPNGTPDTTEQSASSTRGPDVRAVSKTLPPSADGSMACGVPSASPDDGPRPRPRLGLGRLKASSVHIDWSYYGGAESLPPSHLAYYGRTPSFASTASSSSPSTASGAESDAPSLDRRSTPPTSDEEEDRVDDGFAHDATSKGKDAVHAPPPRKASAGSPWLPQIGELEPTDFLWLHTEEPHRSRRRAILADHPEVKTLMGHEPLTKYISLSVTLLQLSVAVLLGHVLAWHPFDWRFLAVAYAVGGTANQNTFLAVHEITHNLAFKSIRMNKAWAILVNGCIGIPYAMLFKPYHIEHHKHLGEDGIDTDLPTRFEMLCLKNVLGKAFFATFQIFFYALRPGFVKAQKPNAWIVANVAFQLLLDAALVWRFGWGPLAYLVESSFFAGSLHPTAAHFIAEHYLFESVQQETWSYYGPLNILAYNVGYHNEHHDFPSVPWTRLPALRRMASEYYDCLPHHTSWPMVTLQFILGERAGVFARIKRKGRGEAVDAQQRRLRQRPRDGTGVVVAAGGGAATEAVEAS